MKFTFELSRAVNAASALSPQPSALGRQALLPRRYFPEEAAAMRRVNDFNKKMIRMYDAALTDRLSEDLTVSLTSANAEILTSLTGTRSRARRAQRDDPYAAGMVRTWRNNIAGHDPFRLEMKAGQRNAKGRLIPEPDTNREIEEQWRLAGKRKNCTVRRDMARLEMYHCLVASMKRDGGILARHHRAYPGNPFGYAVELIEIDRLDQNWNRPQVGTGAEIQFGIEMDAWHGPIAYHILTRHPGDVFAFSNQPKYRERVPAADIIPLWNLRDRAGQYVGMSEMASIIKHLHRIEQHDISVVTASINAACKSFWLKKTPGQTPAPYSGDRQDEDGRKFSNMEPGTMEELPEGLEPVMLDPKQPTEAYAPFTQQNLRKIASGIGQTYHGLANDYASINFSSGRLGEMETREGYKVDQRQVVDQFVDEYFCEWLKYAILSGRVNQPISRLEELCQAASFHGRRWGYINPLQDAQASILLIESGLTSREHEILNSERGGDVEQVDQEIAAGREIDQEHDLDFTNSDPTKPTVPNGEPGAEIPNPEDTPPPPAKKGGKQTIQKAKSGKAKSENGEYDLADFRRWRQRARELLNGHGP